MAVRRPNRSPRPVRPVQDVRALTDFRANVAAVLQQVQSTGRPVMLTQHGRSAAVLLDPAVYEALIEELELLRDIQEGERQAAAGEVAPQSTARQQMRKRLG